ncbi:putative squalene monooxygenase [Helianthus debilis subsp. tardiflorus]
MVGELLQPGGYIKLIPMGLEELEQGIVTSFVEDEGTIIGVQHKVKVDEVMKTFAPLIVVYDGCFSNLECSLCKPQVNYPLCFCGADFGELRASISKTQDCHFGRSFTNPVCSSEIRCLVDIPSKKLSSLVMVTCQNI